MSEKNTPSEALQKAYQALSEEEQSRVWKQAKATCDAAGMHAALGAPGRFEACVYGELDKTLSAKKTEQKKSGLQP